MQKKNTPLYESWVPPSISNGNINNNSHMILENKNREAEFSIGYEEGLARAQEELRLTRDQWNILIHSLGNTIDQLNADLSKKVMELAVKLSESVFKYELQFNKIHIEKLSLEAILKLREKSQKIKLLANPTDLEIIKNNLNEVQEIKGVEIEFHSDASLKRGEIFLKSDFRDIHVDIEKYFADMVAHVLDNEKP